MQSLLLIFLDSYLIRSSAENGDQAAATQVSVDGVNVQDKLGLTHYLFFIGNNDSGKSNNLSILHLLAYRNVTSTDMTAANIYQVLGNRDEGQGTICEDEADIDENAERMRVYKNGYTVGFPVLRTGNDSSSPMLMFYIFGTILHSILGKLGLSPGSYSMVVTAAVEPATKL